MLRRPFFGMLASTLLCGGVLVTAACSDDDTTSDPPANPDGGTGSDANNNRDGSSDGSTGVDSSAPVDAGDSGKSDSGTDSGTDSGPTVTVTTTLSSTALITIFQDAIFADFYEDDTIIESSESTQCTAIVKSGTKPVSAAGTITVGGGIVNTDGGAPQTITMTAGPGNAYEYFDTAVYNLTGENTLDIDMTSASAFPKLDVQTLRLPTDEVTTITAPVKPGSGDLNVPSTADFAITWTVPTKTTDLKMIASFEILVFGSKVGRVSCVYPLAAGTGTIPKSLLAALKTTIGGAPTGVFNARVGGAAIVKAGSSRYVIVASPGVDTTTIPANPGMNVTFQ